MGLGHADLALWRIPEEARESGAIRNGLGRYARRTSSMFFLSLDPTETGGRQPCITIL